MEEEWDELKKYTGMWVALYEGKVIASGKSAKETFEKAKKVGKKVVLFQVPDEEELYIL
jgi:hypothetical protein